MIDSTIPPKPRNYLGQSISREPTTATLLSHRLAESGYPQLAGLHIQVEGCTVRLEGQVSSYYLKQMAQTIVLSCDEVTKVENAVVVEH